MGEGKEMDTTGREKRKCKEEGDVGKEREDSEIQGQTRTPTHTRKEGTTKRSTEMLPQPEELNYTVHGQLLAGAIDFKVLSPIMPLHHFESS